MVNKKPRILIWDIESSFNAVLAFQLRQDGYIPHQNIIQERHLYCIGYKWFGERQIHSISILDDPKRFKKDHHDDYYVVSEFRKVLEEADIQVYHHGNKFDMPMFNARMAFHGFPPLPKLATIDTKQVASKHFKFNSNRLDYLGKFLGYKGKMENPSDLWIDAYHGDVTAIKHMVKYCKQDIDITEFVYKTLAPFMRVQNVNMNMFLEGARCPSTACGSTNLQWRGYNRTRTNKYRRFQCNECGAWGDERKATHDTDVKIK